MSDVKFSCDIENIVIGDFKILECNGEIYVFDATDNLLIRFPRSGRDFDAWRDFVYYLLISLKTNMLIQSNRKSPFSKFYKSIYGSKRLDALRYKIYNIQRKESSENKKAAR